MVRTLRATSLGALAMVWWLTYSHPSSASPPCATKVTRDTVVSCAVAASPELRKEAFGVEAMEGRREAQARVLPSSPVLSLGLGRLRAAPAEPNSTLWSAELAQEIEIGGQRGSRLRAAQGEVEAQRKRAEAARLEVATFALDAYFDVLAAGEQARMSATLARTAEALSAAARGRAEAGLLAPIDADVAEASALRIVQERFAAERRLAAARARLAMLVGAEVSVQVEGDLLPLSVPERLDPLLSHAREARPDLAAAEADERAQLARISLHSRARIPNPTLSVFAEREREGEHRYGLGLSFPFSPVGSTARGDIREATALAAQASAEAERIKTRLRLETTTALADFLSLRDEVSAFSDDLLARAREDLDALAREVDTGRLPVRDALLAQQSLIELLRAFIDARHRLCLSSVAVARAASLPLEEVTP